MKLMSETPAAGTCDGGPSEVMRFASSRVNLPIASQEQVEAGGPAAKAATAPGEIDLMRLPIHTFTMDALIEYVIAQSRAGNGGYLMTPNVDNMRDVIRSHALYGLAMDADIRVADGMPLIWASRIRGTPLPGRVAGSDLVTSLAPALAASDRTLFLLGGAPGAADRAAEALRRRAAGLQVVGTYCPPHGFERDPAEVERITASLNKHQPDFVYVGLPFPKASILAARVRGQFPKTWFLGIGISLSFVCGEVERAPDWMQRIGLEWLHRLGQEPGRLSRRYIVDGLPFVIRLFLSSAVERRRLARTLDPGAPRPQARNR